MSSWNQVFRVVRGIRDAVGDYYGVPTNRQDLDDLLGTSFNAPGKSKFTISTEQSGEIPIVPIALGFAVLMILKR